MIHKYRKLVSALCYFLVGIVWYLIDSDAQRDPQVRFHANQGLVFLVFALIYSIALYFIVTLVSLIFSWIPVVGPVIVFLFELLTYLPLVWAIFGVLNAVQEKEEQLPVIGKYNNIFRF